VRRGFMFSKPDADGGAGGAGNEGDAAAQAAAAAATAAAAAGRAKGDAGGGEAAGNETAAKTLTMTQAELDAIVKREKAKQEKATKAEAEEAARVAALSETDRLKAEKVAADAKTTAAIETGKAALVRADAKLAAVVAGASIEKAPLVLRLADLSDIDVTDDVPDAVAIKAAIEKVKAEVPELFVAAGTERSGGDFQGGSSSKKIWTRAEIAALSGTPEFEKYKDDINRAVSEGRIKG